MAITYTKLAEFTSTTDASSYNFGNVTVPADGLLVAVVKGLSAGTRTISSVSLGGSAATIHAKNVTANNRFGGIASREVTAGANNVTVTMSFTAATITCDVYLLEGYSSATPLDSVYLDSAVTSTRAITLNCGTDGFAIYGGMTTDGTATASWSAATEDSDINVESAITSTAAHRTATGASVTETITFSVSSNAIGVGAVWEPAPTTPPVIDTVAAQNAVEESGSGILLEATSDTAVTWTITGGADAALWRIRGDKIIPAQPLDYSDPIDADTNGVHVVEVTATNLSMLTDTLTLNITVTFTVARTGLLKPDDATAATLVYGWDCRYAECFTGSAFPADTGSTTWLDRIGSGDLVTNGGDGLPVFNTEELNGWGALKFDSSNSLAASAIMSGNWSTYTMFLVVKANTADTDKTLLEADTGTFLLRAYNSTDTPSRFVSGIAYARSTGYRVLAYTRNTATSATGVPPGLTATWIDGCCFGSGNGADGGTFGTDDTLIVGGSFGGDYDVAAVYAFRGDLGIVETAQVSRYLMAAFGVASHVSGKAYVALCNSMTAGSDASHVAKVATYHLYDDDGIDVEHYNIAQTGGNDGTLGRQSAMIDALRADLNARGIRTVLQMWHGHNNNSWDAAVQSDIETYPAAWRSSGNRAISITISPRGNALPGEQLTEYAANHAWHAASALGYVDAVGDTTTLAWMATIEAWVADGTNRSGDGLHLTAAGQTAFAAWLAPQIKAQLDALQSGGGSAANLLLMGVG